MTISNITNRSVLQLSKSPTFQIPIRGIPTSLQRILTPIYFNVLLLLGKLTLQNRLIEWRKFSLETMTPLDLKKIPSSHLLDPRPVNTGTIPQTPQRRDPTSTQHPTKPLNISRVAISPPEAATPSIPTPHVRGFGQHVERIEKAKHNTA